MAMFKCVNSNLDKTLTGFVQSTNPPHWFGGGAQNAPNTWTIQEDGLYVINLVLRTSNVNGTISGGVYHNGVMIAGTNNRALGGICTCALIKAKKNDKVGFVSQGDVGSTLTSFTYVKVE